jgi:hypothetical protein
VFGDFRADNAHEKTPGAFAPGVDS